VVGSVVCRGAHPEVSLPVEGTDGKPGQVPRVPVHADSPMAIKAVQIFLKHTEEFSPQTKDLIQEIRLTAGLVELLFRRDAR